MMIYVRPVLLELICDLALGQLSAFVQLLLEPRKVTDKSGTVSYVTLSEAYIYTQFLIQFPSTVLTVQTS